MLAAAVSWRLAFLLPALGAAALVVVLRRLPEPPRSDVPQGGVLTVLRHRWGLVSSASRSSRAARCSGC